MIESLELFHSDVYLFCIAGLLAMIGVGVAKELALSGRIISAILSMCVIAGGGGWLGMRLIDPTFSSTTVIAQNKLIYPELQNTIFTCEKELLLMSTKINGLTEATSIQITKAIVSKGHDCSKPLEVSRPAMADILIKSLNRQLSPYEQKAFVERNHILVKRINKNAKPMLVFSL